MRLVNERRFRGVVLAAVGLCAGVGAACDGAFTLENGQPRVTWVALEPLDGERAALTLWVEDAEGDAVDVAISWMVGAETGPLVLARGSAPLLGLPTQLGLNSDGGQPHRVLWDLSGVPQGPAVLLLQVDDRPHAGSAGDVYRTEAIDPRLGGGPVAAVR